MKISWVILTHNRFEVVNKAIEHNLLNVGTNEVEIIWVDNGSRTAQCFLNLTAKTRIFNSENLGVSRGYNRGLAMATGDYILITGCDRLMPEDFLNRMLNQFILKPDSAIISIYSKPKHLVPERFPDPTKVLVATPHLLEGLPLEAKLIPMHLFKMIGYFHEGLGLYGWEDCLWAERAQKVAKENGLTNYVLIDEVAQHLGSEGIEEYNGQDDKAYHEFKRREATDPKKIEVCEAYRAAGHPYINPFI